MRSTPTPHYGLLVDGLDLRSKGAGEAAPVALLFGAEVLAVDGLPGALVMVINMGLVGPGLGVT